MRCLIIAIAILAVCQARPGLVFTQPFAPIGVQYANTVPAVHPHPSVELNAASEALLPRYIAYYHRNPYYVLTFCFSETIFVYLIVKLMWVRFTAHTPLCGVNTTSYFMTYRLPQVCATRSDGQMSKNN